MVTLHYRRIRFPSLINDSSIFSCLVVKISLRISLKTRILYLPLSVDLLWGIQLKIGLGAGGA